MQSLLDREEQATMSSKHEEWSWKTGITSWGAASGWLNEVLLLHVSPKTFRRDLAISRVMNVATRDSGLVKIRI